MHLYVAGPMTGLPGFNFQNFIDADEYLHNHGFTTFNPAVHEIEEGIVPYPEILECKGDHAELAALGVPFDINQALLRDMTAIAEAEGVVLIDGWERSSGAFLEAVAALWTGKSLWTLERVEGPLMEDSWVLMPLPVAYFNQVAFEKYAASPRILGAQA